MKPPLTWTSIEIQKGEALIFSNEWGQTRDAGIPGVTATGSTKVRRPSP